MIQIEVKIGGEELAKVLHYYGLLESGNEFKLICPFHEDINPSMAINLNSGVFFCFGCNVSGNAYDFVKLVNKNLDELKSWYEYFKILRSNRTKEIVVKPGTSNKKANQQTIIEAKDFYFNLKTVDWGQEECYGKDYLMQRGFSPETLTLCKAKPTYDRAYPIVFPMMDMGHFKGWVCRTTNKIIEKKRKYLYNKGFSRRNTIVGRYDSKVVILVEGYMDWLKMKQFGVKKVGALLGWKATAEQINKLKASGVETVISALDNDKCGREGTEYLKQFFKVVRFQFPPGVKDPGEMTERLFRIANDKTKQLYRRMNNGQSGRNRRARI